MYRFILYSILAGFLLSCQSGSLPEGVTVSDASNVVSIAYNGASFEVMALSDDIVRISYSDSITYSDRVYGPILSESIPVKVTEKNGVLCIETEKVRVEADVEKAQFAFFDKATGLKLSEELGYVRNEDTTAFRFGLQAGEAIYGTGSRSIPMNRRGYKFQCFNQANYGYGVGTDFLNYSVPAFLSSQKYMVLIDNPARAWFDIGKTNEDVLEFASMGGNMSYYFINGANYDEVMINYGKLTGTQPLPPVWAFGNLQSRFGYRNQAEAEAVVEQMVASGYPIDALIIDLYWFGEELQDGKMGNLAWDKNNWPNPEQMIQKFAQQGVKAITVSEPFFTKKSQHFNYLSENKLLGLDSKGNTLTMPYFYFGDGGLIDIFKPEARDWFWQQYKKGKEQGIAGWWGDLGEPEVHPDSMVHVNGLAQEVHGVYGHEWISMLYENYAKEYPNERLFKLGRAGYAGTQRYGLLPWSGDVGRNWSGLHAQNNVMLGMGLSGLPYMHSDAGGFAGGERDSLLYMRWLQYAVFTPVFRPHGDPNAPAEPIFYHQKVQDIVKEAVKLRYAMLPYNYTLAWKTSQTNLPMARPLFFEFEDENIADTISDAYMWGENLLVAPVFSASAKVVDVYLPQGDWYGFNNNKHYKGGVSIQATVEDASIPVFAKGGSFVPMAKVEQSTDNYKGDSLIIYCYLNKDKNDFVGEVYFDDGKTKGAYAKGQYELLKLSCKGSGANTTIDFIVDGDSYNAAPEMRAITLKVVGLSEAPEKLSVNGEQGKVFFDNGVLQIENLNTSLETQIVF